MNTKTKLPVAAASLLLSAVLMGGTVQAEEATSPLQFWSGDNGSYAKVTFGASFGFFAQSNTSFGANVDSDSWMESVIRPGLEFNFGLDNTQSIYGALDITQSNTFGGNDASLSNVGYDDHSLRFDHAYIGWKSGDLFSALGEDAIDVKIGRDKYVVGNGFLFANQGGAGWGRAAYWIGGRNSADYLGVIKMTSGNWSGDVAYFKADNTGSADTKVGGGNVEYNEEGMYYVGAGIYGVDSDTEKRDSMMIYNGRVGINPFAIAGVDALKPLHLEFEYVYEDKDNNFKNGNAWYAQIGYTFENCPYTPTLTYRYASFDTEYDSMYYGSTGWEQWYQGEIIGEYGVAVDADDNSYWNSNLETHMLKLSVQPTDAVTVTMAYLNYNEYSSGKDIAQEYDVIVDWNVTDYLYLSLVGGIATPDEVYEKNVGDDNWSYMMIFGSISF
ncbi:hypothetical protein JWJ90_06530 [Desulfobulbus rhabdoformis]|uniref:hypothetical protein n=1 Tax=Desulfobulbus rhabdoformis TaxID=34032 RepID=UPI001962FECD|nr:hypothetical protein [Desulfobulbus rhabdoformis]MBM9613945.1 hypothetical protein [Desulfobulbus rhabdoformis]